MCAKSRTIEIDADTAAVLEERAAQRGISIAKLVAEPIEIDREPRLRC